MVLHEARVSQHLDGPVAKGFLSGELGAAFAVGPIVLSLDDIEHGILRGSPPGDSRSFADFDPRRTLAVTSPDPRIHFALNHGTPSCPSLRVFSSPPTLNKELKTAAADFVEASTRVSVETGEVRLSKTFERYCCDFAPSGGEAKLLRVLMGYLPFTSPIRARLSDAKGMVTHGYGRVRFVYVD